MASSTLAGTQDTSGYNGVIYHYYSSELTEHFATSGMAINKSSNPSDFDYHGVFTPGAMYDNTTDEWLIYYGGVRNGSSSHTENIGLAISKNGVNGPFIKQRRFNPIITLDEIFWCLPNISTPARVDEAKPYIINNRRMIYTKGVCNNFTALDGIWFSSDNNNTWNAPYTVSTEYSPIVNSLNTVDHKGFENVKIFMGPDGYLHLTGHDHGDNQCPHYISDDNNNGFKWKLVNLMNEFGLPIYEPAPVYPYGVPGDQGGIPKYMIQFVNSSTPYHIDLMNLTWIESNQSNSALFS